jgi:hypothetical protein
MSSTHLVNFHNNDLYNEKKSLKQYQFAKKVMEKNFLAENKRAE